MSKGRKTVHEDWDSCNTSGARDAYLSGGEQQFTFSTAFTLLSQRSKPGLLGRRIRPAATALIKLTMRAARYMLSTFPSV